MKKYIVIYHATYESMKQTATTNPEDATKSMEAWMEWAKNCGDNLVDMGTPLSRGARLNSDGSTEASGRNVVGYSILQAESMEAARCLLARHPHLSWDEGCEIEVHESMALPGN